MKGFLKRTLITLLVCAVPLMGAFGAGKGKVKKETVTFASDVMVNGTLVKAGDYELKFNEETGELTILKDGKVKAKAKARVEARSEKARHTSVRTLDKGGASELISITFGGSNQDVVLGARGGAVTGNN